MTESFEDMFRRIVREEVETVLAPILDQFRTVEARREQIEAKRAPATDVEGASPWEDLEEFGLKSGSKTYTVRKGYPVKVKGFGRGGAAGDGYVVTRIQRRRSPVDGPTSIEAVNAWAEDINVEVRKGRDHARTVKSDKIIYKRPKKAN